MPLSLSSFYRHSISKFTPEDATGSVTTNTGFIDSESKLPEHLVVNVVNIFSESDGNDEFTGVTDPS